MKYSETDKALWRDLYVNKGTIRSVSESTGAGRTTVWKHLKHLIQAGDRKVLARYLINISEFRERGSEATAEKFRQLRERKSHEEADT